MIKLTDKDLYTFLQCPAMWNAKRTGKYKEGERELLNKYFEMYLFEDESFPTWQIENSDSIFYSSGRGGLKPAFNQCHIAAERLLADPYISNIIFNTEALEVEAEVFGVPVKFQMNGVDLENQCFIIPILGPRNINQKYQTQIMDGEVYYQHWIIANHWPAMAYFYRTAIREAFCVACLPLLAAVEKSLIPDFRLLKISDELVLMEQYQTIKKALEKMNDIKAGHISSESIEKCGRCDYCKTNKKITEPEELTLNFNS